MDPIKSNSQDTAECLLSKKSKFQLFLESRVQLFGSLILDHFTLETFAFSCRLFTGPFTLATAYFLTVFFWDRLSSYDRTLSFYHCKSNLYGHISIKNDTFDILFLHGIILSSDDLGRMLMMQILVFLSEKEEIDFYLKN